MTQRLQAALAAKPRRVLVIGAGFIGSEVASVCRQLGLEVTVAERAAAPLAGALGGVVGAIAAEIQRAHGVDLRLGVSVQALEGDSNGHVRRVRLSDGTTLEVDVVLASLGSLRNIEWLEGAGLAAGFWGVACDAGCRAFDVHGVVTDNWIHLPVPRERDDAAYFAPLRGLKRASGTELYLGLVHFTDGLAGARRRLAATASAVTDFGIATECGLGRRPPATIADLFRLHAAIATT